MDVEFRWLGAQFQAHARTLIDLRNLEKCNKIEECSMQKVTTPITETHGCRRKGKAPILKLQLCYSLIILHYMAKARVLYCEPKCPIVCHRVAVYQLSLA